MTRRTYAIVSVLIALAILVGLFWERDTANAPENANKLAADYTPIPVQSMIGGPGESSILRYRPECNPNHSEESATVYYARREALIRNFHGDDQVDQVMDGLRSGENIATWIGQAERQEMVQALPLIAGMLNHPDEIVRRVAVRALCTFGDKRGFEYVLSKMEGRASDEWWSIFENDFASHAPSEYLPRIKSLLSKKEASTVEIVLIAKVLAEFGDPVAAQYLVPMVESAPERSVETILKLANVVHPSVTALAQKLSAIGATNRVKLAADVVLAKRGDPIAEQRLVGAARRVIDLPQPQNPDGTYKPGLKQKFIGAPTPAWDGDAVFALDHGMAVVDPTHAVPVLRDIAIHADNVSFSGTAVKSLAKVGNEAARAALWDVARSAQARRRPFEDTIFTTIGKALMLFDDETSASLAQSMFGADEHTMEVSRFLAESRGWEGLFHLDIFY